MRTTTDSATGTNSFDVLCSGSRRQKIVVMNNMVSSLYGRPSSLLDSVQLLSFIPSSRFYKLPCICVCVCMCGVQHLENVSLPKCPRGISPPWCTESTRHSFGCCRCHDAPTQCKAQPAAQEAVTSGVWKVLPGCVSFGRLHVSPKRPKGGAHTDSEQMCSQKVFQV